MSTKNDLSILSPPLDFASIQRVPESHAWELHSSESLQTKSTAIYTDDDLSTLIPVVDLNDPNVVEVVGHACETLGVFQLVNHGVPDKIFDDIEFEARNLFHLPLEEKKKALRSSGAAAGYGVLPLTPFYRKMMWCESFTMKGLSVLDDAKKIWPNDYKPFCDVMEAYRRNMKTLAGKLTNLVVKSLNLPEETILNLTNQINDQEADNDGATLHINYYPPCPNPDLAMGAAPHTDSLLMAILHQAKTKDDCGNGALQVFKEGVGWIPVYLKAGALIVNVGDLLHILTNGRFHNVLHRAVINHDSNSDRISVVYFYGPPPHFQVTPFPITSDDKIQFRSLTVKEWSSLRWKNQRTALSHIRI